MSRHRVCVPPDILDQPTITLSPSVAHYVMHVLRLRVGDEMAAFDGTGQECLLRLTSVSATHVQGERLTGKMARWQRIAAAAARQCGRRTFLDIQPPMGLGDFCGRYASAPVKLVCWEEERLHGMRQVFERLTGQSPIVVLIGPEGGL